MDLDPKGANNQIKEVIDRNQHGNDDEEVVVCQDSNEDSSAAGPSAAAGAQTARRRTNSQYEPMDADTDDNLSLDNLGNAEVSI